MKANIITEEIMENWYVIGSWLYWKHDIGRKIKKNSLAGSFNKSSGYYRVSLNGTEYHIHRILYQFYHNVILTENDIVDHHDRNPQNNSKENLILGDKSENSCNRKVSKTNLSTGIKNISKNTNKSGTEHYYIKIKKNYKIVFSKYCRTDEYTKEDVIKIRDAELIKHHGDFASCS